MANSYSEGDAGQYPQKHNKREIKVIETAKAYTPNDATDWTLLPGNPTAPNDADDAFDKLAAAVAEGVAKEVTGSLSVAQMAALHTTGVEAIAAPGAGKAIIVDEVELFLDYSGAALAAGAGDDLVLQSATTGTDYAVFDDADAILEGTADTRRLQKCGETLYDSFDLLTIDNEAVEWKNAAGTGAYTTTSVTSTWYYRIKYREITLITGA